MDFNEFKAVVLTKAKEKNLSKDALIRLRTEIFHAEVYYKEVGDLYEVLHTKPIRTNTGVIPYILGLTNELDLSKSIELVQTKAGSSGGIDVDSDLSGTGRQKVIQYLKSKYGEDCVIPVGTLSTLQMKVACKDLLRYVNCPVAESNDFTSELDDEISFEDNMKKLLQGNSPAKNTYLKYQNILDLVPRFLNKPRNIGMHAGGVVLTPKPIWNYCPVERSSDSIVTAWEENGSNTVLDENGLVKLDILSISVLDVIDEVFGLIDERLFLIEEDGIEKIVPYSYLKEHSEEIVKSL